jgi:hypothetical protein
MEVHRALRTPHSLENRLREGGEVVSLTEKVFSLRKVMFSIKDMTVDNAQNCHSNINIKLSTYR